MPRKVCDQPVPYRKGSVPVEVLTAAHADLRHQGVVAIGLDHEVNVRRPPAPVRGILDQVAHPPVIRDWIPDGDDRPERIATVRLSSIAPGFAFRPWPG